MMSTIESIRAEYLRYKALAEAAIAQVNESDLSVQPSGTDNSIAVICWHVSGNFESRFTDFLTSDGEKPWRSREEEFQSRTTTRAELLAKWSRGWEVVLRALAELKDEDLQRTVTIRRQPLQVNEALHRSFGHLAYHVGQIVYIGKSLRGTDWHFLSIPPGQSDAYNQAPAIERASAHAQTLADRTERHALPAGLPVPVDDGACDHLAGANLPSILLKSTVGEQVDLSRLTGRTVVYVYPRTGRPEESTSEKWDAIPGARGCTPQSCGFRDHYEELQSLGARVFGLSTQTSGYQQEAAARLHLPFPLLSDSRLAFTHALRLPTFEFEPYGAESSVHLKRMTIVIRDGVVEKLFYPVVPPDRNAGQVVAWLREHPVAAPQAL